MKKIILLLVATVMVFSVLAACANETPDTPTDIPAGEVPLADAPVTDTPADNGDKHLIIAHSQDPRALPPNDMMFTQTILNRTGFTVDWISIPNEGAGERTQLMLASRDLPCVFLGLLGRDDIMRYKEQDMFVPVQDLIDNYMPLLSYVLDQRPNFREMMIAPDGQIWGFPYIEEMWGLILNQGTLAINHVWLEELGIAMPTTLEEFGNALRAFRDYDPGGVGNVIPLSFAGRYGSTGLGRWANGNDFGNFMGLFGQPSPGDLLMLDDNGQIFFTGTTEAFRDMYRFFHEWYAEGLIDQEIFNNGYAEFSAKLRDGVVGAAINFALPDRMPQDMLDNYTTMPNLTSAQGRWGTRQNLSEMHRPVTFVITTACCNPANAAIFADAFYDPQTSVEANWGPLDYVYVLDENGQMVWGELQDGLDTFDDMRARHTLGGRQPLAILNHFYGTVVEYPQNAQIILDAHRDQGFFDYHFYTPYIPPLWFTVEEANRIAVLQVQIYENTVDPWRRGWIVDGGVDEQWEDFLAALEANGLPEFLEIMQTAFDRLGR